MGIKQRGRGWIKQREHSVVCTDEISCTSCVKVHVRTSTTRYVGTYVQDEHHIPMLG